MSTRPVIQCPDAYCKIDIGSLLKNVLFFTVYFFNWCDTDTYSCVHLPFGLTCRWLDRGNGWLAMRRGGKAPVYYYLLLLVSDNQDRDFQWMNSYLQCVCLCGICFIAKHMFYFIAVLSYEEKGSLGSVLVNRARRLLLLLLFGAN